MKMTSELKSRKNATNFRERISNLFRASVGVVLTRTREPHRACETLVGLGFAKGLPVWEWDVSSGWHQYTPNGNLDNAPVLEVVQPYEALKLLHGEPNSPEKGYFIVHYPHYYLPKHPAMIQLLKNYVRQFAADAQKRLVLLCPPGFTAPPELEDDLVILDFDPPSYAELIDAANDVLAGIPEAKRPQLGAAELQKLVVLGTGMTHIDFVRALSRSLIEQAKKLPNVTADDLTPTIMSVKIEVVRRSEVLEVVTPESMALVGGLQNLKDWVAKRRGCFGDEAAKQGIEPPKGVFLVGPPGTGKSLAAKAIASTLELPLIRFDISRVFNAYVGSSEARVRAALNMVDNLAPVVIFIDEVDKMFQANGGGGDSGTSQRVLGAVLNWMQETKSPVFTVMTANRVGSLPSELIRPGRIDAVFAVSMPNPEERREVLEIHLKRRKQNPASIDDIDLVIDRSEGMVPAEIEVAVKEALIEAAFLKQALSGKLIAEAMGRRVPLSVAFADDFLAMQTWAEKNAQPASRSQEPAVKTRRRVVAKGGTLSLDG